MRAAGALAASLGDAGVVARKPDGRVARRRMSVPPVLRAGRMPHGGQVQRGEQVASEGERKGECGQAANRDRQRHRYFR